MAQDLIDLDSQLLKFFSQRFVPEHGIATDLLISVRGHARKISNVRLQARLAVANRLTKQLRRNCI